MAEDKDPRTTSLVGRTIQGKWRLEQQLGTGGMASVWSARHRNGKRVAIKLLHRELAGDEHIRKRFLREGYLANKVEHPAVVNILDDDSEDDLVFIVMELLEGQTLAQRWKSSNKRLDLATVLRVTDEVLDVLVAAHDKEIVHRDIKPANIFLTNAGEVKVLDFGIARLKEGAASTGMTTRLGTALGSPAFMSPEQARARWEFVDARTDLWGLGAVMFSTLSGEFVHGSLTASEMIIATATRPARSLQNAWPEAPDVVAAIVDRALAYERADRWQDARSMQAAVRRAMKIDFAKPRRMLPSMTDLTDVDPLPPAMSPVPASRPPPDFAAKIERRTSEPPLVSASSPPPAEPLPSSPPASVSAPPPSVSVGTTTSAPVAAPETTPPPPPRAEPEHRSVRSMAVLGGFIAIGLSIAGVAIGTLSRRTVVVTVPAAPPATQPTVSAAVSAPAPAAEPAPSVTASAAPAAEPVASATASAAPSAAPTTTSRARGAKKAPPPPAKKAPPAKGKFDPSGL